jgi:hypothetical protein
VLKESKIVLTWRLGNKPGVYLLKEHYDVVSTFILSKLKEREAIKLEELIDGIKEISLDRSADLAWILLQVKSDLEAKKLITVNVIGPSRQQIVNLNTAIKSWWVNGSSR